MVNLGGAAASFYAIGYGRREQEPRRVLPFFPVFLAGMNLVLLADDAFTFLLVLGADVARLLGAGDGPSRRARERRAPATSISSWRRIGAFALLLAFGLLAGPDGAYAFAAMRAHAPSRRPRPAWSLGLALLGAGSKAGLAPLHVWLPLAHPAAPSHVSALMSGVMTKVAVYGFIRIVFDLLGPAHGGGRVPVLAAGAATSVLGVLFALMQSDLKRVLAY